ncbi:MAG: VanZ family protein [Muribaculaceae bacterium]|nr:VanZ family protein [Muribaculaceae bacterium]
MNRLLRLPQWTLTAVVTAAVLWLTLAPHPLPDEMDVPLFEDIDKVVHAIMMGGLAAAAALDTMRRHKGGRNGARRWERLRPRACVIIIVAVSIFGGAIELTQEAMGLGRGAEWGDLTADIVGAIIASLIFLKSPWPRSQQTQG